MPTFSHGDTPQRRFAHQPPDPALTDPFTVLRPQDLAHAAIAEDPAPFGVDDAHECSQAAILKFSCRGTATLAPGVVLTPRHTKAITHVSYRIAVIERGDHLIPVGWREAK